jgi:dynein heavy chain 1, cytosolic
MVVKSFEETLNPAKPLSQQLQLITLSTSNIPSGADDSNSYLYPFQRYIQQVYTPLTKLKSSLNADPNAAENVVNLQKRVRDLDLALEQCYRGTSIPRIELPVPSVLMPSVSSTSVTVLRGFLEKYNPSQVDQLFSELGLDKVMGNSSESKEEFANIVNKSAKTWPQEISRQLRLLESPFPGTIEKEINFWKEIEKKLIDSKGQLESAPLLLTKLVLKRTNRVSEQLIYEAETDLDRSLEAVQESNAFLRDFPLDDLLTASDLQPKLNRAVSMSLQHFNKLRHSKYEFSRAVRLLESLGQMVFQKIVMILKEKNILQCPIDILRSLGKQFSEVYQTWESQLTNVKMILKDVAKRRSEKLKTLTFEIEALHLRMLNILEFREQHEKLVSVFANVLSGQSDSAVADTHEAYQSVVRSNVDLLDVSPSNATIWQSLRQMYEKRLERTEDRITKLLEERLNIAKSADEMFKIFSTFNPLFFRPSIRNAVNAFRVILVRNVREDVKRLQDKFRFRYDESLERITADLHDIPPLSGRIIWARQIENQLSTLMKRLEDVIGAGWEDHIEGKQLKEVCDELRNYLDTNVLYNEWLSQQLRIDMQRSNRVKDFLLVIEEDNKIEPIRVNFDERQVVNFKEVRYLEWLLPSMSTTHKTIPRTIQSQSAEAYARYPVATALQAAISGFYLAKKHIHDRNEILLAGHISAVRDAMKEAFGGSKRSKRWIKWDSTDLNDWVSQLSSKVITLQERVDDVNEKINKVESLLSQLSTCNYQREIFEEVLASIQQVVDEMQMKGYVNVLAWVASLDQRIEDVIATRIANGITSWTKSFAVDAIYANAESNEEDINPVEEVSLEVTVHEILLSNQVLFLSPSLEQSKYDWIQNLHQYIGQISTLPRLVTSRFNVFADTSIIAKDYAEVIRKVDTQIYNNALFTIESKIQAAKKYVQNWLQYQALWDTSAAEVSDKVGKDISKWLQLLNEIKSSRQTIDSSNEEKSFGPIIINQHQVQNKVNLKYDTWQKDCQTRFSVILADEIKSFYAELSSNKAKLENISLDGQTRDVIIGVEFMLKIKATLLAKKKYVQDLDASEKLLQKQRFSFPREWFSATNVSSAFHDFSQILLRRYQAMESQMLALQSKIKEEYSTVSAQIEELVESWDKSKPDSGGLVVSEVMNTLSKYTSQIQMLTEDFTRIRSAKDALEMDITMDIAKLTFLSQELDGLKELWIAVAPIYDKLNLLRAISLKDIVTTKIRKGLDEIGEQVRALPPKFKSYAAVEWLQDQITKLLSTQAVLRDLTSEALKDRHWKLLLQILNISRSAVLSPGELSLGMVWDSNPLPQKKAIGDVLSTAQGELALEQFLRDLRENWLEYELTLITRDNAKLIAGWDVLFSTLEDNLNSLASMKQSPYFRNVPEFQEDTANWESRLTNLRGIFEIWIEVQRKWIYLRGIFRNADIKAQLPSQYTKFKSVDNEFSSLMKRVITKPSALELLQIDNLHRQLERQDSTMSLIQKALGEYLERQRQYFPRFYFVNNDDLVEIIGNSNEPAKIIVHLSKMFAAITTVDILDKSENSMSESPSKSQHALSMISKEGEIVPLLSQVDVSVSAKDWLGSLQDEMRKTLASLLQSSLLNASASDSASLIAWINSFPAQIVILASQVAWCEACEASFAIGSDGVAAVVTSIENKLRILSENVLKDMSADLRQKCEQLLTETVHQRDVGRGLRSESVTSKDDFAWLYHLRFYWSPKESDLMKRLSIKMSSASFYYGFEYLGIGERLVQTPLTDRCYLTLTQALHHRFGSSSYGPAGTGKTESVKMLGSQLGRFVLVFNCDASFDYAAMGRIFSGLCQVGAWGCFDEFNRLEERILSAVSQQILTIQRGLMLQQENIELLPGQSCKLHKDVGIFVTLNPGYAGRSNLPDNLKQLFRAVAMTVPDRKLIAQVMLYAQGITTAEDLAGKIVLLFTMCEEQLSLQSHYDFGLRALKSVLTGAGELKRLALKSNIDTATESNMSEVEKQVLIKSTCDSVVPKLVSDDIPLFLSLMKAVFPGATIPVSNEAKLIAAIEQVCQEDLLDYSGKWSEKILQLKQVLDMRHGVMMVGPSSTGKTTAWKTLFKALSRMDGVKGEYHIIDPKSIKKETLYGVLDPNTLEWTDGIFTKVLRKVSEVSEARAQGALRRSWIVFDGDVDPEWAENLNSVLDDNKVLTLPNGDRLQIPNNVKIMMEVDSLQYATLATVSRCGMVWFASDTITLDMILNHHLKKYRQESLFTDLGVTISSEVMKQTQNMFADAIASKYTAAPGIIGTALEFALQQPHIMEATASRLLNTLFALVTRGILLALEYNDNHLDFPMSLSHMQQYSMKWLLYSMLWAFGGSMSHERRSALGEMLFEHSILIDPPSGNKKLVDLFVNVQDGSWLEWSTMVGPRIEIESHKVVSSDVVINTVDTVRHTEVLRAWLASHQNLILCGPPGSGKTMTLTALLEAMPDYILASLNFSSTTSPDLILKTFLQFCEVVDSPDGLVLQPNRASYRESQWLVIFCDEINLPERDKYGTQRVIMFMRQLTEQRGYWNADCKWIKLRRIQFVGACNPPTDAGRVPLPLRFLRHSPLLLVDYPAEVSLHQIYRTFVQGLLKLHPNLKGFVDMLTSAMVEFFFVNQHRFSADQAPQYIYSPRELSRWVRAMYEAMEPLDAMSKEELIRLWAHEGLRLFHDRLISDDDRKWCEEQLDLVASKHFAGGVDLLSTLARPMLYSKWIRRNYQSTDREELRSFVAQRLKVFYEEELDVPLVIFDEVLDHVLRIDNVLRHPMGHMLLAGESGTGKTVLSRFVAWINGLSVFQIKADHRYSLQQFDEDLRSLLRRVGVEGEKICFIFDESNALSTAFLERMNALLACGEVPGLFEGEDRAQLLLAYRESLKSEVLIDSEDELWRSFTRLIQRNLHVVFTMNPSSSEYANRCTTSPALFNRCVVDWFGTWSASALIQVAHEFTMQLDTGYTTCNCPSTIRNKQVAETFGLAIEILKSGNGQGNPDLHDAVVAALVMMHDCVKHLTNRQKLYISPRDYLDLIHHFTATEQEKRANLEDQQTHIHTGLRKLIETQDRVSELQSEMVKTDTILRSKDSEANAKLTLMVDKQNEAEMKKSIAEKLTAELQSQNEEIRVRLDVVERELADAEPALQSAKQSVQNIRRAQLDEVRILTRPPNLVRLTCEMVCVMMGEKNLDWNEIRKVIRGDDFISTVVNFDPSSLSMKQVKTVQDEYLSQAEFNYESVDRASKACGPLFLWGESQIRYAVILRKIKPLRDEVLTLQEKSSELQAKQQEAVKQVQTLEKDIQRYKAEYAAAIRDTEIIRGEMEVVKKKVSRAEALLSSLEQENVRWKAASESFDKQMETLIGDCLLTGAFLTYAGHFDHRQRKNMLLDWFEILEALGIPYRSDWDVLSFMSNPSDQMSWRNNGLSSDEVAMQNAILLDRYQRYPLIIDPAGHASAYLMKKLSSAKITQTSFLDSSFFKILASAIRFGTPLLVQDVDNVDPILNPILNKEIQRTGGRTLIRLGSEDIDFSPKFSLFLTTRNPNAKFPPDLCSRVTVVNFTVTSASLHAQVLSAVLRAERPDVDHRRNELFYLQSQQAAKLRELEESLLNQISMVQGAILDDDSVILRLESIKREAADLSMEARNTASVVEELALISKFYDPLASMITLVYFTLSALADINPLYQFSLNFFLSILQKVLSSSAATKSNDQQQSTDRLKILSIGFFQEIARRVLRSLKYDDKILFMVRLAQIASTSASANASAVDDLSTIESDLFYRGVASAHRHSNETNEQLKKCQEILQLDDLATKRLTNLASLPAFQQLPTTMIKDPQAFIGFLQSSIISIETVPMNWLPSSTPAASSTRLALLQCLLVQALRPDLLVVALEHYIAVIFANNLTWRDFVRIDLRAVMTEDAHAGAPILICSDRGQDASHQVDQLAGSMQQNLLQVAMGSTEGYSEADRIVAQGAKLGSWVLLRNVHLCLEWLALLEKRLSSTIASAHPNFRLFLTSSMNVDLPSGLLLLSEKLVYEASSGIKANLTRFYRSIPHTRIDRAPLERSRLYSLIVWMHAVIQERLRYMPLGWTKRYEFTETDTSFALDVIDEWIDSAAAGRSHIDPSHIPWQAIRTLLSQSIYGGRIDNIFDQMALDSFLNSVFTPASYSSKAVLADTVPMLPESVNRSAFESWINALPDTNSPTWIGLPATAETQVRIQSALQIVTRLTLLQGLTSSIHELEDSKATGSSSAMKSAMVENLERWMSMLKAAINQAIFTMTLLDHSVYDAIQRCILREIATAKSIGGTVYQDLAAVRYV